MTMSAATAGSPMMSYTKDDFAASPFVAFYEVTRACDLVCKHCRACAQPKRHPNELNTQQSKALLDQFAQFPKKPTLIFTGGDPMKRDDIYDLVRHAADLGIVTAMTPSATPLVTYDALARLRDAGISRLALSLDGADAETHDGFRGVPGSYERTFEILADARRAGITLQINTTITKRNLDQVDAMAELIAANDIVLWSVFLLVPIGRGLAEQRIAPEQYEVLFERLWDQSQKQKYAIKTTEAHHYRRFAIGKADDALAAGHPAGPVNRPIRDRIQRAPLGVNDGKGCMFVSHTGTVYPSGFMALACGRFPKDSIVDVYQNSPIFQALRDPDRLGGKCGVCEYRSICGGSRARAFSLTRDPLAAEPDCVYIPGTKRPNMQL
ncbi:MAG: TIGR04053 family radical SAM/SPASM domain-containing protein [Capsulimonadaceae bacterium]|nr:TIGR04053 family radical SAM/SPASM domain-containing protein [Capsulimonadaceae bacterium]